MIFSNSRTLPGEREPKEIRPFLHWNPLSMDHFDETEQRLRAEFAKCVRERAIAESNPRHSILSEEYMTLLAVADALGDKCDRIRVKIREHRSANAGDA
jgi:hypothetical protein